VAGCGSRDDHESRPRSDISQAPRLRVIAAEVFAEDVCPYIRVTDDYGRLICSAVEILGGVSPSSVQDLVIRDLLSDVFDFLYEGRRVIMSGQCATALPLASSCIRVPLPHGGVLLRSQRSPSGGILVSRFPIAKFARSTDLQRQARRLSDDGRCASDGRASGRNFDCKYLLLCVLR